MKKLYPLFICIVFCLSTYKVFGASDTLYAGGSGTEADPFLIENAEHLDNVRENPDAHFLQVADIQLDSTDFSQANSWSPIGNCDANLEGTPFTGLYDGDGFEIRGLKLENSEAIPLGLFGCSQNATFRNIQLIDVEINSVGWSGALVGYNLSGNATHIDGIIASVTGQWGEECGGIIGRGDSVLVNNSSVVVQFTATENSGGIAGFLTNSQISNSEASGEISGWEHLGGIIGRIDDGVVSDCESTVTITSDDGECGGIVGNINRSSIINCHYEGEMFSPEGRAMGGIAGIMFFGELINCTSSGLIECIGTAGGIIGNMADGLIDGCSSTMRVIANFGFSGGLAGVANRSFITNSSFTGEVGLEGSGLNNGGIAGFVSLNTTLENVSMSGSVVGDRECGGIVGTLTNSSSIKKAVCDANIITNIAAGGIVGSLNDAILDSVIFNGTVETNESAAGICGRVLGVSQSVITRAINNGTVSGGDNSGGIVGVQSGPLNLNSSSNFGQVDGSNRVGGMVGQVINQIGEYKGLQSFGAVLGFENVGGIFGSVQTNNEIVVDSIHVTSFISGESKVGGIAGFIENAIMSNLTSEAEIIAGTKVGGIVGEMESVTIERSYFNGLIESDAQSGGLAGYAKNSTFSNSYARGDIFELEGMAGGIVGSGEDVEIIHCYSTVMMEPNDNNLSGQTSSVQIINSYYSINIIPGDPLDDYGRPFDQMIYRYDLNVYEDWDFNEIWRHDFSGEENDGFPYFRSEQDQGFWYVRILPYHNLMGSAEGDGYFDAGEEVLVSAIAEQGYEFIHWVDTLGNVVSEEENYAFNMPAENLYLLPIFDQGTFTRNIEDIEIKIYPNPVADYLHIDSEGKIRGVVLFNSSGTEVYQSKISAENIRLDLGRLNLTSGIYRIGLEMVDGWIFREIAVISN